MNKNTRKLNSKILIQLGKLLASDLNETQYNALLEINADSEKLMNESNRLKYEAEASLRRIHNLGLI